MGRLTYTCVHCWARTSDLHAHTVHLRDTGDNAFSEDRCPILFAQRNQGNPDLLATLPEPGVA